jgi:hypothetical protein
MRVLALHVIVIFLVLFSASPAHAGRGGIVIINYGEDTLHIRDLPPEVANQIGYPTLAYRYDLFGVFWLDLWRWGGEFVVYDEGQLSYAPLTAEDLEALGGAGVPWKYRAPPGLLIVLGLIYLGTFFGRRRRIAAELAIAAAWIAVAVVLYQKAVGLASLVPAILGVLHLCNLVRGKKPDGDDVQHAPAASPPGEAQGDAGHPHAMRSGPLPVIPDHLRGRLRYAAVSIELTAGGIDVRHEDGTMRLVLWRDVVGVVVRRAPPEYHAAVFIDIVSTAGATVRVLPWTLVTGELGPVDPDVRPRAVLEYVLAHCPVVQLDPGTQHFVETGGVIQLPDADTLREHDERLA